MPKLRPIIEPYTKEEINDILNLQGWLNESIDVFQLYGVLTIGVSSGPENNNTWEIQQRTYNENKLPITLKDFENCQNRNDVRKAFNKALRKTVAACMFKGSEAYDLSFLGPLP